MSVIDDIEEIEAGLRQQRYPEEVVSTAREIRDLFPDMDNALEYVAAYREAYDDSTVDDPASFARSWHETFDGDMSRITDELLYED